MSSLGPGRYGWFVVLAALAFVVYVTINGLSTEGRTARGFAEGARLPPFAALLATADVPCDSESDPCDANVARRPGSGRAGRRPACGLRGPTLLNSCQLTERGPAVLAFFVARGDCPSDLDVLDDARRRHPGVRFAAVGFLGDRSDLREVIAERRWGFPVAWDRDGALANLFGVAVCPQIVFVRYRGRVQQTINRAIGAPELERRLRTLKTASRRAGWKPG